jgi:hypothetical protein
MESVVVGEKNYNSAGSPIYTGVRGSSFHLQPIPLFGTGCGANVMTSLRKGGGMRGGARRERPHDVEHTVEY